MMDPKRAVDAILAGPQNVGKHTVYPLSIGRFACLEKIESPLLTGKDDAMKTIATAWVMTRDIDEIASVATRPDIIQQKSIVWADTVDQHEFAAITSSIVSMLETLYDTSPDDGAESKKKQQTEL